MHAVRIYTTPTCPYCIGALGFLRAKKIPFEQIDVSRDPEKRAWLAKVTGMRTVPQIFVGERSIGGFTDMLALERSGELEPLLREARGEAIENP